MKMVFYMYMPVRKQHLVNINNKNKICAIVIYDNASQTCTQ